MSSKSLMEMLYIVSENFPYFRDARLITTMTSNLVGLYLLQPSEVVRGFSTRCFLTHSTTPILTADQNLLTENPYLHALRIAQKSFKI